jgi:predicted esterase
MIYVPHMNRCIGLGMLAVLPVGVAPFASAQDAPAIVRQAATAPAVTRADMARSFLYFEQALQRSHPDAETLEAISRSFDGLTGRFFMGDFSGSIAELTRLTRRLESPSQADVALVCRVADALKVEVDPPVCDRHASVTARIGAIYSVKMPDGERVDVSVRLVNTGSDQAIDRTISLDRCLTRELLASVTIDLDKESAAPGSWSVRIGAPNGASEIAGEREVGRLSVLPRGTLAARKTEFLDALDRAAAREGAKVDAIAAARSRAGVLADRPSAARSAEFLFDPTQLVRELESEVRTIESGANPYEDRRGDWWREVSVGDGKISVPMRTYAPPRAAGGRNQDPMPLVIALHGAGGDENMFMDAYGCGEIKRLADRHGFVVASPSAVRGATPAGFDAVLAAMESNYSIDRSRVYVVGHSMGAMGAANLAISRGNRIAAVACFAGGPMRIRAGRPAPSAPILVMAGGSDSIIPPARLKPMAERACAAGDSVEYREVPGLGHTLVVGARLGEAVEWLLGHRIDVR